jgi:hypothetical protein
MPSPLLVGVLAGRELPWRTAGISSAGADGYCCRNAMYGRLETWVKRWVLGRVFLL